MFRKSILYFIALFFLIFILFEVKAAKAEILIPNGSGFYANWQNNGGGAATFDRIDDYPTADSDTTYNATSTADTQQSYTFANTNKTTGVIKNIKVWAKSRSNGTPGSIKLFLRVNNSDYFSNEIFVTGSYTDYYYQWNINPFNESNWSISDLDSLEAGFRLFSGSADHRITQFFIQIQYDSEINVSRYHITQKLLPISDSETINENFSFPISNDIDEIKSAYFEIKGVTLPISSMTIDVSIDESGSPNPVGSPRLKTYSIDASGRVTPFKFTYDATDYFKSFITNSGEYSKWFNLKVNGQSVYVLSAKLIITYSWVKPSQAGLYKISGFLISPTFDTQVANGAGYNSIMWLGILNSGKVKLQLAASNCSNGATDYPTCVTGTWSYIGGNACSNSDYYESISGTPAQLKCYSDFNNKRYFRYKITLCSYDCVSASANTPQTNDVVVNYSP